MKLGVSQLLHALLGTRLSVSEACQGRGQLGHGCVKAIDSGRQLHRGCTPREYAMHYTLPGGLAWV